MLFVMCSKFSINICAIPLIKRLRTTHIVPYHLENPGQHIRESEGLAPCPTFAEKTLAVGPAPGMAIKWHMVFPRVLERNRWHRGVGSAARSFLKPVMPHVDWLLGTHESSIAPHILPLVAKKGLCGRNQT